MGVTVATTSGQVNAGLTGVATIGPGVTLQAAPTMVPAGSIIELGNGSGATFQVMIWSPIWLMNFTFILIYDF